MYKDSKQKDIIKQSFVFSLQILAKMFSVSRLRMNVKIGILEKN